MFWNFIRKTTLLTKYNTTFSRNSRFYIKFSFCTTFKNHITFLYLIVEDTQEEEMAAANFSLSHSFDNFKLKILTFPPKKPRLHDLCLIPRYFLFTLRDKQLFGGREDRFRVLFFWGFFGEVSRGYLCVLQGFSFSLWLSSSGVHFHRFVLLKVENEKGQRRCTCFFC